MGRRRGRPRASARAALVVAAGTLVDAASTTPEATRRPAPGRWRRKVATTRSSTLLRYAPWLALEPGRPGIADLYLVAAGLYAREDVFMKEVKMHRERCFASDSTRTGAPSSSSTIPKTIDAYPAGEPDQPCVPRLRRVGELMNTGRRRAGALPVVPRIGEPRARRRLLAACALDPIDPPALKSALDEAGIRWKIVVVSACYSGGFVEPLKDELTMVITASSADAAIVRLRQRIGRHVSRQGALRARSCARPIRSRKRFESARKSIEEREREPGLRAVRAADAHGPGPARQAGGDRAAPCRSRGRRRERRPRQRSVIPPTAGIP